MTENAENQKTFLGYPRDDVEFSAKALLLAVPLIANASLVSWVIGMCLRFDIPMNMINVTPTQAFVASVQGIVVSILIFGTPPIAHRLWENSARKYRRVFSLKQPEKPKPSITLSVIPDRSAVFLLAYLAVAFPLAGLFDGAFWYPIVDWPIVEKTTTCVILLQMGDSYIAADVVGNGRIRATFTVYRADKLPSFGMRRLGVLTGALQESNTTPTPPRTACPKVSDSDAKHP